MKFATIRFSCLMTFLVLFCSASLNAADWEKLVAAGPAVVSIQSQLGQEHSIPEDCSPEDGMWSIYQPETVSFLEWILQRIPPTPQTRRSGYGFFISSDGYILTSYLTVKDAQKITVTLSEDLHTENVALVGYDAKTNLALLKIDGENYTYLTLDTCGAKVGEWVMGLGRTESGEDAPRFGVISYFPDSTSHEITFETLIQSGLPKSEMTGDPLLNMDGRVLGVNVVSETLLTLTIPSYIPQEVVNRWIAGHVQM